MENVTFVERKQVVAKDKPKDRMVFKVISLGSFMQELPDNVTILNRPQICVDDKRKKWGNEYILLNKNVTDPKFRCFLGSFGLDKKRRMNVHLFKEIEIPIRKPDYYILTIKHEGKLDKAFDLIKADASSFSKIFSSAYHYYQDEDRYACETTLVLQHGDKVMLEGSEYVFSGKSESLE